MVTTTSGPRSDSFCPSYWLLPPLMLLSLWAFRRRGAAALVVLCVVLPLATPGPARAAERSWWERQDQRDQATQSSGVDAYRRGDFEAAQRQFDNVNDAEGRYNLGNALARQGQYDAAIAAYDEALKLRPGMPDALANRAAVDAARKRKPPPGKGQQQQQQQQQQQSSQQQTPDPSQQGQQGQQGQQQGQTPPQQKPDEAKPDAAQQARADAAQRERMREALQRQQADAGKSSTQRAGKAETAQEREQRQAVEAWMRRVPDDPGSLLRRKFQLENERRKREGQ